MNNFEFKNTMVGSDGKPIFVKLSNEQKKRIPDYIEVLRTAYGSDVPRPPYSNYFCKEAIGVVGGPKVPAGNIEYGVCQALHGEEAAVAAFRAFYRRKPENEKVVLGILADQPGEIPALCGNCRDILLDEFGPDLEVVAGSPEFKSVIIVSMRNYLFSNFEELYNSSCIDRGLFSHYFEMKDNWCMDRMNNDVYSGNLHPERKYYVMIDTIAGDFFGAFDIMCDYHSIYPLRDAIRQIRRGWHTYLKIRGVYILFKGLKDGMLPHVMYKDRQHLLELNAQGEQFCQREMDPPVFIFDSRDGQLVRVYRTTVKEWLPFAFVPSAFDNNFKK